MAVGLLLGICLGLLFGIISGVKLIYFFYWSHMPYFDEMPDNSAYSSSIVPWDEFEIRYRTATAEDNAYIDHWIEQYASGDVVMSDFHEDLMGSGLDFVNFRRNNSLTRPGIDRCRAEYTKSTQGRTRYLQRQDDVYWKFFIYYEYNEEIGSCDPALYNNTPIDIELSGILQPPDGMPFAP